MSVYFLRLLCSWRGGGRGKNPHLKCIPTTADAVNFVDITVLHLRGKVAFFFSVFILLVVLKLFLRTDLESPFMRLFPEVSGLFTTTLPCLSKSIHPHLHPTGDQGQSCPGTAPGLPM